MNLYDAIDKEHFIIDDTRYTDADLQGMPLEELETLKMRINKKISGLSVSLKEKQIEYASGGRGADKEWFINRKLAMSINQRVLTYVNSLIKQRQRKARSISDFFMEEAKTVLPRDDFERVLNGAHEKMGKREGA